MTDTSGLMLTLPAKPENVAVIRHAVAGLAEELGMSETGVGDLKTVVTEACMNVVVHAYDGEPGPLQVEVAREPEGLTVCVRDFGHGIRPRPDLDRPSLRLGLTLIAALSNSFEIAGGLQRGTEIRMHLLLQDNAAAVPSDARPERPQTEDDTAQLTIVSPEMIAPVLGRVVGALVARRPITVDRLSDALLLTDAVSRRATDAFTDGHFRFAVKDDDSGIDLRVGPLPTGVAEELRDGLELPEVGGSLESLADEVSVENGNAGDYLVARFAALPI
jgi:anti-sigma regulatory factor (Ser/Thr protein kinase)